MIKQTYNSKNRIKTTEKQTSPSVKPEPKPLVEAVLSASKVPLAAAASASNCQSGPRPHLVIKLGIDVRLDRYVVVRQIDGGAPQPPQRFSPGQFLEWAQKQTALAQQVYSCYEAGPFGYRLHRKLKELGITNYVIRPRDWDEYGKKVKTDKRDAKEMVLNLDRYVSGNQEAFCLVRVPTEVEEQARSRSRQRESLQKEKQRLAAQGRSHALYYGAHLEGAWWTGGLWQELVVPPIVLELLELLRRLIQALEQELKSLTQALSDAAPEQLPMGLGKLTYEVLEREVADWNRFDNRRQVASYTGMCPREDSSDGDDFKAPSTSTATRACARSWWRLPGDWCNTSPLTSRWPGGCRCWSIPKPPDPSASKSLWPSAASLVWTGGECARGAAKRPIWG